MIRHSVLLALCYALIAFCSTAAGQQRTSVSASPTRIVANQLSRIPTPRAVLGFAPGDSRTIADYRQITNYFRRLDAASDRIQLETLGKTTLGRELFVAYISASENIRNLQKYKDIQRRLADPRLIRDDRERQRLISEGRTVVVISCSIHSTEIVASQMSMQLAYELASARDTATLDHLRNTILILIPSANPDGVDIVANWYRRTLGTPYEGIEPPELYHHYAGHDNNRDWYMLNLAETRHITRLFWREWFPQIVYDVHQQGATGARFFIPPFHDPANPLIPPSLLRETGALGYRIAADLQASGQKGVITNAIYDMWWHGGFRTAPYYHNSIGILSEAASARLMTPITVTPEQLKRATSRGMTSALDPAINFPEPWTGGEWRPADIMRMEMTAARTVLREAAVNRERLLRNSHELARNASNVSTETDQPLAYLIPAGQARDEAVAKLVTLLIEQGVEVHRLDSDLHITASAASADSSFVETPAGGYIVFLQQPFRQNIRALFEAQSYPTRMTANGEAERPYDVTGWTLQMQMGIEVEAVRDIRELAGERRLTLMREEADVRRDLSLPLQLANVAASTPLRSPTVNPIRAQARVALYRSWVPNMDEGWTRYVFDSHNIAYTTLRDSEVRRGDLRAQFDVVILPSQRMRSIIEGNATKDYPAEFTGGITQEGVANLRRFVEAGGTLICFDQSAELAIKEFKLPVRNVLAEAKPSQFYCPGSVLRLDVDTAHPLARGLRSETDAYFINSSAFETIGETKANPVRVVARYAQRDLLRSGYLLGADLIAGQSALIEVDMERGRVILFGFRPQHRAQTWGTYPFIFNALAAER
jgi:hypothetical protein